MTGPRRLDGDERWRPGDVIVRREVVAGKPWLVAPVIVVADEPDLLAVYLARGAPLVYPPGDFPRGEHPWSRRGKTRWQGNGVLQLHRPGDWHAVMAFWAGTERAFHGWYVNFQEPFRRHGRGFDTRDLELDLWIPRGGAWSWKDEEAFAEHVAAGHITAAEADAVRAEALSIERQLERGERWWDETWASWSPDPSWGAPELPAGWDEP